MTLWPPSGRQRTSWIATSLALVLALTVIPSAFASTTGNLGGNIIEIDGTQIAGAAAGLGMGANLYPDGYTGAPYSSSNPAPTSPHLNANANIDWVKSSTGNIGTNCLNVTDFATCDQAGVTASTNGAGDWNGLRIVDGIGNNDQDIFTKGGKENDTSTWTVGPGSVGSAKYDITQAYIANTATSNTSGYLFFGMERRGNDGTTAFDFEFNAKAPAAGSRYVPTRTVGDVLFTFEMQGSGSSGSAVPHVFTWNGSAYIEQTNLAAGEVVTSINNAPTPGAPWGFVNSKGNWTDSSATSASGMLPNFEFAEAAVKIGAGGVALPGVGACGGVAYSEVRTRSSATDTSDLKDTTKIFPFNFGSPTAAATLAALCPPTQGSAPQFSYDGRASTDSSGNTNSSNLSYSWNISVAPTSVTLSGGGVAGTATAGQYTSTASNGTVDVIFPADTTVTQASVTVKNTVSENGACSNSTGNLTVTVYRGLGATATLAPTCGFGVSYSSSVSGGLAPYTYSWAFYKVGAGTGGSDLQVGTSTSASGTFDATSSGAGSYYGKLTVTDSADTTNYGAGVTGKGSCTFNVTSSTIQVFGPLNPTASKSGQDGTALTVTGSGGANAATLLQWQYQDSSGNWHNIGTADTSTTASLTNATALTLGELNFRGSSSIAKSQTSSTATIGSSSYVGQLYTIVLRLHAERSASAGGTTSDCTADSSPVTLTLFIGVDP